MRVRFRNLFLILLVLLPLLLSIPGSSTDQGVHKVNNYKIAFSPDVGPVSFSAYQLNSNSNVNFFYSYNTNKGLMVSNSTFFPYNPILSMELVNLTPLTNASVIHDFNYFMCNNSQFVILSTFSNVYGSQVSIFDLSNNNNFTISSNTTYKLGSMTNLGNSSDEVYFSFYNTTMFSIVRYNFTSNKFSFFFNSTNLRNTNDTLNTNEFIYNSQLYVSLTAQNRYDLANSNSNIFIFNNNGIIFNKTFTGLNLSSFIPFDHGLILYSQATNSYYKYLYSIGFYLSISPIFGNYYNVTELSPLNNNSFILLNSDLNYNNLLIINIQDTEANSFSINQVYALNQNQLSIHTFVIQGQQYYMLSGIDNYNQIDFSMQDLYTTPSSFLQTTTSSSYYTTSYYQSTNNPTLTNVNNLSSLFAVIFVIVLLIVGVFFVRFAIRDRPRNRNSSRNNYYLTRNQYPSQLRNQSTPKIHNSYCSNCGTLVLPEDIFCQNCGNRI